jgi:hypothetical protein
VDPTGAQPLLAEGEPARAGPVDWQLAADPGLGRIVRDGTVLAQPIRTLASFVVEDGQPGPQRA